VVLRTIGAFPAGVTRRAALVPANPVKRLVACSRYGRYLTARLEKGLYEYFVNKKIPKLQYWRVIALKLTYGHLGDTNNRRC
jgi:hypothetical protein